MGRDASQGKGKLPNFSAGSEVTSSSDYWILLQDPAMLTYRAK